jgi:hypothetical protein
MRPDGEGKHDGIMNRWFVKKLDDVEARLHGDVA